MLSATTQKELEAALRSNDLARAGALAEAAIARGESHTTLFKLAAIARRQAGDNRGAVVLYIRATALAPGDADIFAAAGDAMRYTGQLKEAVAHFDRALALDPSMVGAWYGRALALEAEGALEEAQRSYIRVTELAPDTSPGFAGLASMQAQLGDIAKARSNVKRAQALGPYESGTLLALARCDIAECLYQDAAAGLRALLNQPVLTPEDEILAHELLGNALDKMGLADAAFQSYTRANARFASAHGGPDLPPVALNAIEAIDAGVSSLSTGALTRAGEEAGSEAAGHIFLLGYPRSGTTLTEQILATIPGVVSLEEAPTFAAAEHYLSRDGIAALTALGRNEAAQFRRDYWARVLSAGVDVAGKTFIDMDPLKGAALPLIARLFPNAKIIVMHRDPRDVVWSCFRRNFVFSPLTYEFTSLQRTARHYDAVMTLIRRCLETLPLTAHVLRYEDLVRDFDSTTQALCDFLGLPWSSDLSTFGATSRTRTVRTASGPQVRRGLFDGTGQWHNYARYLEPVMPFLQPWIAPIMPTRDPR